MTDYKDDFKDRVRPLRPRSGDGDGHDPFDLRPNPVGPPPMPEGISDGAYTWRQAHLTMAQAQAGLWFHGESAPTAMEIAKRAGAEIATALTDLSEEGQQVGLGAAFVMDAGMRAGLPFDPMRDPELHLEHSPEGGRLRATLGELGVNMTTLDTGDMVGLWQSAFGTPFIQRCTLHSAPNGERYYFWHSTLLVSNRPIIAGSSPLTDLARLVALPRLLQTIAYLSETPYPSTPYFTLDRSALIGADGAALPTALVAYRQFTQCLVHSEANTINMAGVSAAVDLGYVIPCSFTDADLKRAIAIAGDGAIHQNTMIEDGYRNHSKSDELPFQLHLLSGSATGVNEQRWIAGLAVHEVINQATSLRTQSEQKVMPADQVDSALLSQAVGLPFVWAVNNDVFQRLVPDKRFAEARALLEIAVAYDEGIESVNSRSNQAVVEYESGNVEAAIPLFEGLIDIEDPFVEEEPRYYLGVIAMDRGDRDTARSHFQWIVDNHARHSNYLAPARDRLKILDGDSDATVVPIRRNSDSGTRFDARCEILGELWFSHRDNDEFSEYMEYNDVGLPLAYAASQGLSTPSEQGIIYINESWDLLLEMLGMDDDGFESLDDLIDTEE